MRKILWIATMVMLFASGLSAQQDISGDWQGTLERGGQKLRGILRVTKGDDGALRGMIIPVDGTNDWGLGIPVTSMTLQGPTLKFTVASNQGVYEGTLSSDGMSITGTWKQGQTPAQPLIYQRATKDTAWKDPSPHTVQFVTVEKDVKLEVLDWGGAGKPLILLAGLGNTAHVFDKFAPKLTPAHHVYGITRRGFGASSTPATGYSADRLGDDVMAVMDALQIDKPVLVGHSIAGEELSSIGSRHPEKVAGLVYLDAGYSYAFYNRSSGDLLLDLFDLEKKLRDLEPANIKQDPKPLIQETLGNLLLFEKDLQLWLQNLQDAPPAPAGAQPSGPSPQAAMAVVEGEQKFTNVPVPILAFFAVPRDFGPIAGMDSATRATFEARQNSGIEEQAKAFETGLPSSRVVRLPHANHYVFVSNEADVLREMNAFLAGLR